MRKSNSSFLRSDDAAAILIACTIFLIGWISLSIPFAPPSLKPYWLQLSEWNSNPTDAFFSSYTRKASAPPDSIADRFLSKGNSLWLSAIVTLMAIGGLFLLGKSLMCPSSADHHENSKSTRRSWVVAFVGLYFLTVLSWVLANQQVIKYANLEYPLWGLVIGMVISNTLGTPNWLRHAVHPELFVKTGIILLGAEVLFGKLLILGLPGMLVSWTVTPVVLITTYLFGQYVLRLPSKSLNLVISADMSVCGVSAAIATGAACRAKKEEVSLAIALSLIFTVVMMIVMPIVIRMVGMNDVIAGAWLGGTIDSTGAVAAASESLKSPTATEVATTIKMIQNILIGVVAFAVAVFWSMLPEDEQNKGNMDTTGETSEPTSHSKSVTEIWRRFPKFALGFLTASVVFSWLQASGVSGNSLVNGVVEGISKPLRTWFFALAFVAIGLDSNLRAYGSMLRDGKPIVLYLVGQALNLVLSLLMATLVFGYWFSQAAQQLQK
jgi:uncharacterized membrane protein YadS